MGTLYAATLGQSPGFARMYVYIYMYTYTYTIYIYIYNIHIHTHIHIHIYIYMYKSKYMIFVYLIYLLIYPPIHLSIPLTGIPAKGVAFLLASHCSRASAAMRATYVLPHSNLALHGSPSTSRTWINGDLLKSTMKIYENGLWKMNLEKLCILRLSPCTYLKLRIHFAH